ncbi:MAG: tetratricopeptide repeat protein [Armatimonadota bacterium]|nr:tetratricopeptide repeat protein [Armatimonadota bacterium]MDR7531941.1 tetratricopeptide repeat protein [Armatimonadota bacterium]
MSRDPNRADSPLDEGERYLEAGEWAAAEAAFRRAIEAEASSHVAYSKLGVVLARQRRLDEAEQAFARAVSLNPRYAPAWSNLGNVYRETGRVQEALDAYQRAIAADPDYWIAHQNLGGLYKQLGRTGEAIASLRRATRLSLKATVRPSRSGDGRRAGCLGMVVMLMVTLVGLGILVAASF